MVNKSKRWFTSWGVRTLFLWAICISVDAKCETYVRSNSNATEHLVNIPTSSAAEALNLLAEQTKALLIFPYDIAESRTAKAVSGNYSIKEALDLILNDSGLIAEISDKGVIRVRIENSVEMTNKQRSDMKTQKSILATILAALFTTTVASAQESEQIKEKEEVEVIQVTGMVGSLIKSMGEKRTASSVVDVISSEDMGKFPDQNLAESLQRVSGVSISRARGEGSRISVRGLGTGFNLVTLNGATATSASSDVNGNGGRDFAFEVMPANLISGIEVYKSSMADLNEGSLGASVNIKTAHPLDNPGLHMSGSIENAYSELADANDPEASFIFSNTNDDETFGALLALSYSKRSIRQDSFIVNGHIPADDTLTSALGLTPGVDNPMVATDATWGVLENERKRFGIGGSLQFRPTDSIDITYDGFYSDLEEEGNAASINMQPMTAGNNNTTGTVTNGVVTSLAGDRLNSTYSILNVSNGNDNIVFPGNNKFQNHDLNATWYLTDALEMDAKVYYSKSESFYDFKRYQANFVDATGAYSYDQSNIGDVADLDFAGVDFSDPSIYQINQLLGVDVVGDEDEKGVQFDFNLNIGGDLIESVEFGVQKKVRERTQSRDLYFSGPDNVAYPDSIDLRPYPSDILSFSSAEFPRNVIYSDFAAVEDALTDGGIPFDSSLTAFSYNIKEDVLAAYAKANFVSSVADVPVSGNVGLRYVDTDQTSNGLSQVLLGVDPENRDLPIFSDDTQPISETNDYSNWLWSLNVKADLTDKVVARFSAANVMSRAPVSRLAPAITSLNIPNGTMGKGNPQLKPFEATQYDLTLEWYFSDLGALTAGLFLKDVNTLVKIEGLEEEIADGIVLNVTKPVNAEGVTIKGLELAYQQQFTSLPGWASGLGMIVNYTYTDNDAYFEHQYVAEGTGLVGASEDNFNIVAFYEDETFSARIGYNYRSEFLEREVGLNANAEYVDAYGQVDAQASYEINDHISLYVNATDITNETLFRYSNNNPNQTRAITQTGARYSVGVRASF
ncbi:TonB-dependent receptor [uncultured Paraglaciecola sp.]|uniref:TonB-dependent receptor n=1 Tax=uncultured Paraglaciecola sp. TaxID=1765024 RepID=UPI0030DC4CE0|tara:strand:- start:60940 stop:63999 length:3060 start_codon:yes stop_codon:yes gene_type:complete